MPPQRKCAPVKQWEAMHGHMWLLVVFKGNYWMTVISILMILLADLSLCFFNIFMITTEHHVMINIVLLVFYAN